MRAFAGQFLRFGMVGTLAFAIDAGTLWLLMGAGVGPFVGRIVSFIPAFAANFLLNRLWTFGRKAGDRTASQASRYLMVQLTGMAINYTVFAGIVAAFGQDRRLAMLAVAAGSMAAVSFNFLGARYLVFRRRG
ncbi:GtrA family protein [Qipengyuania sp. MTN3-11]|uniref:GtrA family protein n=1 Tax=Qipengyuania sp. MTN3-11 TaxID=3056557 RepID=UPI0036F40189